MRRLGVRVPHGAPNKKSSSQKGSFYLRAYKQRDSNPKGPLRPRECPVDIRSAACPSMHSMRRTPYAQHTGKSLMARQTETLIERWVFLFVCISIKGTRTQRSLCSLLRLRLRCPFFQRIALQLFGKKGAGPLRPRECPVDIRSAACPSMRRTPDA